MQGKKVDFAAHKIGDSRLCDTELSGNLRLAQTGPGDVIFQDPH